VDKAKFIISIWQRFLDKADNSELSQDDKLLVL